MRFGLFCGFFLFGSCIFVLGYLIDWSLDSCWGLDLELYHLIVCGSVKQISAQLGDCYVLIKKPFCLPQRCKQFDDGYFID